MELFVRNIRLDAQLHADILIALSDVRGEVEKTAEVEITLESGVHLLDSDATGGREGPPSQPRLSLSAGLRLHHS